MIGLRLYSSVELMLYKRIISNRVIWGKQAAQYISPNRVDTSLSTNTMGKGIRREIGIRREKEYDGKRNTSADRILHPANMCFSYHSYT